MRPSRTPSRIHSAPARVLPAPRPPMNSQMRQSSCGGSCSLRAQNVHVLRSRRSASVSLSAARTLALSFGGKELIELADKFILESLILNVCANAFAVATPFGGVQSVKIAH